MTRVADLQDKVREQRAEIEDLKARNQRQTHAIDGYRGELEHVHALCLEEQLRAETLRGVIDDVHVQRAALRAEAELIGEDYIRARLDEVEHTAHVEARIRDLEATASGVPF